MNDNIKQRPVFGWGERVENRRQYQIGAQGVLNVPGASMTLYYERDPQEGFDQQRDALKEHLAAQYGTDDGILIGEGHFRGEPVLQVELKRGALRGYLQHENERDSRYGEAGRGR